MTSRAAPVGPPPFDQQVETGGYAWWYLDAISDNGEYGLTLIAFIGSVFSPYYAWSRASGRNNPLNHCAINLALYGPGGRWCMTERDEPAVHRQEHTFRVGPSALHWNGGTLEIDVDEWSFPWLRRVQGRLRVTPTLSVGSTIGLDPDERHLWTPVWPECRVDVDLDHPEWRWSGAAYFDHNTGPEPLEEAFESWFWLRAHTAKGPVVLYDTRLRDGSEHHRALRFGPGAATERLSAPERVDLPRGLWGVDRPTRSEGGEARLIRRWEDTPFYTRSLVETRLMDEVAIAVHESLSLNRFSSPIVRLMLPFRMPRRTSRPRKGRRS